MRALGKNVFKTALLVIVIGQLAGCISMAKGLGTLGYPTFETTEQTWPALSNEKSGEKQVSPAPASLNSPGSLLRSKRGARAKSVRQSYL